MVLTIAFPFVAIVLVLFGDQIIPAGKNLEYHTFVVTERSDVYKLNVMAPDFSGEELYLRADGLIKPLLEFTSADCKALGFNESKTGVYWKSAHSNYCKFGTDNRLISLSIDGSSEICLGKSESGPFVCLPTTRKEFEAVFGKPKKIRYFYERTRWN